jgi:hypothetical protein
MECGALTAAFVFYSGRRNKSDGKAPHSKIKTEFRSEKDTEAEADILLHGQPGEDTTILEDEDKRSSVATLQGPVSLLKRGRAGTHAGVPE